MMAAAAYALRRALARWDTRWAVAGGVTPGLALATKYTAIVLAPVVPVLALARAMDPGGWPTRHRGTGSSSTASAGGAWSATRSTSTRCRPRQ